MTTPPATTTEPTPTTTPQMGTWQRLAEAPISGRYAPVAVWTGTKLLVWMDDAPDGPAVGAAYDLAARSWRMMATSPLGPRESYTTVWTGGELLVFGGSSGDGIATPAGAAYNPASDRWRPIAKRTPVLAQAAAWTGSRMLVWTDTRTAAGATTGALYDLARDSWRILPRAPLAARNGRGRFGAAVVWTGTEALIWSGWTGGARDVPFTDGAAYRPAAL